MENKRNEDKTALNTSKVKEAVGNARLTILDETASVIATHLNRHGEDKVKIPIMPTIYEIAQLESDTSTITKTNTMAHKSYICCYVEWCRKENSVTLLDHDSKPLHELQEIDITSMLIIFSTISTMADLE